MADKFRKQGYENVRYLKGGVDAWKQTGFPMAMETARQIHMYV